MSMTTPTLKRIATACLLTIGLLVSAEAQQTKHLYILQTSDTHSRIEPLMKNAKESDAGLGGVTRRAIFIEDYRKQHPDALLFDCGDISQGTPYYNMFKGEVEIQTMNLIGYDAMALGNHEFDYGLENMARLFRMATFPVLCANYDVRGTVLDGLVKPYTVLKRNGLRIGVFGLGSKLEGLVQADKCVGVVYKNPVEAARQTVSLLKEQERCDVVICLSHLGLIFEPDNSGNVSDNLLVGQTEGIDLILGGHSHTYLEEPVFLQNAEGQEVPIMHIGRNGSYVGVLELTLNKEK